MNTATSLRFGSIQKWVLAVLLDRDTETRSWRDFR
jgi:hypothetical protein